MEKDYSSFLDLLETQLWYFKNVLQRRNHFSNQAMEISVSDYWDAGEDRTPLELTYHALEPLKQMAKILEDKNLEWGDVELEEVTDGTPVEKFIQIYEDTLESAKLSYSNVEFTGFKGNMERYNDLGNIIEFENRLKILSMHALTHMGQIIKFHGMICKSLEKAE